MKRVRFLLVMVFISISCSLRCVAAQNNSDAEAPDFERALGCLRTLNTAAVTYASTYTEGFSPTLAAMGMKPGWTKPTPEWAGLIDEKLTAGKMAGYIFSYRAGLKNQAGKIASYTITARPLKWREGVVSYFTDQTGVIRWTRENRAPTGKDPTIDSLIDSQQK